MADQPPPGDHLPAPHDEPPAQPDYIARSVELMVRRTQRSLSPWVQRMVHTGPQISASPAGRLPSGRASPLAPTEAAVPGTPLARSRRRAAISTAPVGRLVTRIQRAAESTAVWRGDVGPLSPAAVDRFATSIVNRFPPVADKYIPRPAGEAATGQRSPLPLAEALGPADAEHVDGLEGPAYESAPAGPEPATAPAPPPSFPSLPTFAEIQARRLAAQERAASKPIQRRPSPAPAPAPEPGLLPQHLMSPRQISRIASEVARGAEPAPEPPKARRATIEEISPEGERPTPGPPSAVQRAPAPAADEPHPVPAPAADEPHPAPEPAPEPEPRRTPVVQRRAEPQEDRPPLKPPSPRAAETPSRPEVETPARRVPAVQKAPERAERPPEPAAEAADETPPDRPLPLRARVARSDVGRKEAPPSEPPEAPVPGPRIQRAPEPAGPPERARPGPEPAPEPPAAGRDISQAKPAEEALPLRTPPPRVEPPARPPEPEPSEPEATETPPAPLGQQVMARAEAGLNLPLTKPATPAQRSVIRRSPAVSLPPEEEPTVVEPPAPEAAPELTPVLRKPARTIRRQADAPIARREAPAEPEPDRVPPPAVLGSPEHRVPLVTQPDLARTQPETPTAVLPQARVQRAEAETAETTEAEVGAAPLPVRIQRSLVTTATDLPLYQPVRVVEVARPEGAAGAGPAPAPSPPERVQRAAEDLPLRQPRTPEPVVQRVLAEPTDVDEPVETMRARPIDVGDLARRIYPIIKRMLAIERERSGRR